MSPALQITDLAAAAQHIPADRPIIMLNLVRFRPQAQYPSDSDFTPCSGLEAYASRYRNAFQSVAASLHKTTSVVYLGETHGSLLADKDIKEDWDLVVVVKYTSFADIREMLESEAYKRDAEPHRLAALEKWKFIATTEFGG